MGVSCQFCYGVSMRGPGTGPSVTCRVNDYPGKLLGSTGLQAVHLQRSLQEPACSLCLLGLDWWFWTWWPLLGARRWNPLVALGTRHSCEEQISMTLPSWSLQEVQNAFGNLPTRVDTSISVMRWVPGLLWPYGDLFFVSFCKMGHSFRLTWGSGCLY